MWGLRSWYKWRCSLTSWVTHQLTLWWARGVYQLVSAGSVICSSWWVWLTPTVQCELDTLHTKRCVLQLLKFSSKQFLDGGRKLGKGVFYGTPTPCIKPWNSWGRRDLPCIFITPIDWIPGRYHYDMKGKACMYQDHTQFTYCIG